MTNLRFRYIIATLLMLAAVACQKEPKLSIPVEKSFPEQEPLLQEYQSLLESPGSAWEFTWDAKSKGFYAGMFQSTAAGQAKVFIDTNSSASPLAYSFSIVNGKPSILFNRKAGDLQLQAALQGLDSSFTIVSRNADTLFLQGDVQGNKLRLFPASSAMQEAYVQGGVEKIQQLILDLQKRPKYFNQMTYNGDLYEVQFNLSKKTVQIHSGGLLAYRLHECGYALTATGIRLADLFVDGVSSFDHLALRKNGNDYEVTIKDKKSTLQNVAVPNSYNPSAYLDFSKASVKQVQLDLGAGAYTQSYFISRSGFTVAGVEDGFGLRQISGFNGLFFGLSFMNQNPFGIMQLIDPNGNVSDYGVAPMMQLLGNQGLVYFLHYGTLGTIPSDVVTSLTPTLNAFYDSSGFMVIKSGPTSYDLVSYGVSPQRWIRFD